MTLPRVGIVIVLNGEHHIEEQEKNYCLGNNFDKLIFVEGASESIHCTSWCNSMPIDYHKNGSSVDGTLNTLDWYYGSRKHVSIITNPNGLWKGKVEMFNKALELVTEPCYLWQIDVDEYWEKSQLVGAEKILENTGINAAAFNCDYLLSDDIIVRGDWGEAVGHGYRRLWKYTPGQKFLSHEPPVLSGHTQYVNPKVMPRFVHKSYFYEKDVAFKAKWYSGHSNILTGWRDIIHGVTKLPCSVEMLFKQDVHPGWKNTIITYR